MSRELLPETVELLREAARLKYKAWLKLAKALEIESGGENPDAMEAGARRIDCAFLKFLCSSEAIWHGHAFNLTVKATRHFHRDPAYAEALFGAGRAC